jgi:hypothetical protein
MVKHYRLFDEGEWGEIIPQSVLQLLSEYIECHDRNYMFLLIYGIHTFFSSDFLFSNTLPDFFKFERLCQTRLYLFLRVFLPLMS